MKNEKLLPGAGVFKSHNSKLIFKNRINALTQALFIKHAKIV